MITFADSIAFTSSDLIFVISLSTPTAPRFIESYYNETGEINEDRYIEIA